MRAKRATVALSLLLLASAGCTDAGQPSPPPDPVDSISDPSATSAPAPPDTETETATETAGATASPTTEADGPPRLPAEATEQTEAGAEAFVAHYFDLLNYGTMTPDADALADTSTPQCQTCVAFQESLDTLAENEWRSDGPSVDLLSASATQTDEEFSVDSTIAQINPAVLTSGDGVETAAGQPSDVSFTFRLVWTEAGWRVKEVD